MFFRSGVIALMVVALLCAGNAVAAADPVELPAVVANKYNSEDGYNLKVSLVDMKVNAVPNMAATAFTREGFVTATARLDIDGGNETSTNVTSVALQLWAQLSCQIDLSEGMSLGENDSTLSGGLNGNVQIPQNNPGSAEISTFSGGSLDPGFLAKLNPGGIDDKETSLGELRIPERDSAGRDQEATPGEANELRNLREGGHLVRVVNIQDFHVKRDNCGGPVFIRLHARESMYGFKSDDDIDVYSAIVPL